MTGRYQPQRNGADCLLAATATVTGIPYDSLAEATSYRPERGLSMLEITFPLLSFGVTASVIVTTAAPPEMTGNMHLATPEALLEAIKGNSAVLMLKDDRPDQPAAYHAVAWMNGEAINCAGERPKVVTVETDLLAAALVLPDQSKPA